MMLALPTKSSQSTRPSPAATGIVDPIIQRKLSIGASNDIYEKEADAMADKVMGMETSGPLKFSPAGVSPFVIQKIK